MTMRRRGPHFNPGRWRVQRERAQIEDPTPPPAGGDAVPIGRILASVLSGLGLERQRWLGALAADWPALVGETLARHTRPGRMDGGTLIVFVDSSVWLNELKRYGRAPLLDKVRRHAGADKVQSLLLRLDPDRAGAG